jgi:glutamyl-tRNA reductase
LSELLVLGVSHNTAPVETRERLALGERATDTFLAELDGSASEAVVLSTCNRTELYLVAADPVDTESAVLSLLARRAGIRPTELLGSIYSHRNCEAARHLFRVTAGLDSMVVGEAEVQGQVKRAYEHALSARTTGPLTNQLFRAALQTGKRVRTETAIGAGRHSLASVAVDLAEDALGDLSARRVLIIGAGETAELTAQALAERGVRTLFVANRRRDRARTLASRFGGDVASFDELPDELERTDIVIASTSSPHAILGAEELAQVRRRPLLLIDLAVPRDIEPGCAELPGVTVANIDDLQATVRRHLRVRRAEARKAEGVVEEEIQTFAVWLGSLEAVPTVAALRQHGEQIVRGVLAENDGRWENLSERDRARVEAIARTVANRILHEPTLRVKESGAEHRHSRMQLLRELFGLEEPAVQERPAAEVRELRSQQR